jgi:hypothetical protein
MLIYKGNTKFPQVQTGSETVERCGDLEYYNLEDWISKLPTIPSILESDAVHEEMNHHILSQDMHV